MTPEDQTQTPIAESFVRRYGTLIHVFCAVASISITWYISSSVNAADLNNRVTKNTEEIREIKTSMQQLLTKEVYEAREKGNTDRAERMEKMLLQILNDQRK